MNTLNYVMAQLQSPRVVWLITFAVLIALSLVGGAAETSSCGPAAC